MQITVRDKEVLGRIQQCAILTTRQIAAQFFPGVAMTTVLRRLRALESARLIRRIEGLAAGQCAWMLTEKSAQRFPEHSVKLHIARSLLDHDLKLTVLQLRLEEHGLARSWKPEHEIRSKAAEVYGRRALNERTIPDGIMGVEIKGVNESVAVELELNFKNARRYMRTAWDYQAKRSLWAVWYVVEKEMIGRHLEKTWRLYSIGVSGTPRFLWSVLDDVMADPAKAKVWFQGTTYRLEEIWKASAPEERTKPAHTPAHPMSGPEEKRPGTETNVNIESDTETLAEAG